MGLVVGRSYVWCLVIIVIFMGFGQAEAKRCGGCLKVINWGWRRKSQKGGSFHREERFSLLYCETLLKVLLGIYCKRFYCVRGWQGQKCNSKCPNDINTDGVIPEKFLGF